MKNEQLEYIFSYGHEFLPSFSYGFSLKLHTHKIHSYSATGIGADVGILYQPEGRFRNFRIGTNLQNILEPSLKLKNDTTKYPVNLKAGVSYHRGGLIISVDMDKSRVTELKWHSGIEYSIYKTLSLRIGLDQEDFTCGFGIRYKGLSFDYAYAGQELKDTHKFAANLYLGKTVEQMRQVLIKKEEEELNKKIEEELSKKEQLQTQLAFTKGKDLFNTQQYKEAMIQFERVLNWEPEHKEANQYLIQAKDEYQKATAKEQIKQHLEKGKNYLNNQEYIDAALEFKQVLLLDPANSQALASLAKATENIKLDIRKVDRMSQYFNQGVEAYTNSKLVEAIASWKQVLEINPNHPETLDYMEKATAKLRAEYIFAGKKYHQQKMWEKAILEFEKVLSIDPGNEEAKKLIKEAKLQIEMTKTKEYRALAYLDEGIELYEAGEYEEANKKLQKALILNEKLNDAQRYLEKSNTKLTQLKKKKVALNPQLTKQLIIAYDKGLKFFHDQKIIPAIEQLELVYKHDPDYREVKFYLIKGYLVAGMEYYTSGRLQESINTWQKILKIDTDNQKALNYINRTKIELSKIEEITVK